MDYEAVKKEPFRYFNEFVEWAKVFPLDEKSVQVIFEVLRKVENDLMQGRYIQAVIESSSVEKNPEKFLYLLQKYLPDFNIRWIIGLVLGKYNMISVQKIDDNKTKLAYIISKTHYQELSQEMKDEIIQMLKSGDEEEISIIINNLTSLNKNNEFKDLLLGIEKKYIPLLLNRIAYSDMDLLPYYPLFEKAILNNVKDADIAWRCIYFRDLTKEQITELCIITLKNYRPFDFQFFEWCIKEKVKKMPELVDSILNRINELDDFNIRCLWSIFTEGNPGKTVEASKRILEMDDGSESTRKRLGMYFYEIKQKLYHFGDKGECIFLYNVLYGWLKDREFIHVPVLTEEKLRQMDKKQLLYVLHDITQQAFGRPSDFKKNKIVVTLKKYPNLFTYLNQHINQLLDIKRYHPLLVYLSKASDQERLDYDWCSEILNKIEYYFTFFPTVTNQKYPKQRDAVKSMISDIFSGFDGFISQVHVFEKLHKSGLIVFCEPVVGKSNPDYLINLNGKKVVVEVKNYMMSEDIRISGFGSDIEAKFNRDIRQAFFQSVPKYEPQYPVVLVFDTSRSMIEEEIVHNAFHGTLSYLISIEKPQEGMMAYRKKDFLSSNYTLARYVQAAILFRPRMDKNKLILEGKIIEHIYRDNIFNSSNFETIQQVFFG